MWNEELSNLFSLPSSGSQANTPESASDKLLEPEWHLRCLDKETIKIFSICLHWKYHILNCQVWKTDASDFTNIQEHNRNVRCVQFWERNRKKKRNINHTPKCSSVFIRFNSPSHKWWIQRLRKFIEFLFSSWFQCYVKGEIGTVFYLIIILKYFLVIYSYLLI